MASPSSRMTSSSTFLGKKQLPAGRSIVLPANRQQEGLFGGLEKRGLISMDPMMEDYPFLSAQLLPKVMDPSNIIIACNAGCTEKGDGLRPSL